MQFISENARKLLRCHSGDDILSCVQPVRSTIDELTEDIGCCDDHAKDMTPPKEQNVRLVREDGVHDIHVEVHTIDMEGCEGGLVLLRDARVEELSGRDLRLATQFRNVGRLYQAIIHNLRTPVSSIFLYARLLEDLANQSTKFSEDEARRHHEYLDVIKDAVRMLDQSLSLLLDELVVPNRTDSIVDLRQVAHSVSRLLAPQAQRQRVAITTSIPGEQLLCSGSETRIKQAILNVASNALEALAGGGTIEVELVSCESFADIHVRDSGTRIPANIRSRIFDKYFTTKKSGTGIGLFVSRQSMIELGGTIELVSTGASGTDFRIRIPLVKETTPQETRTGELETAR
ncbi:sensor histidine kinase [Kolteria novifilia]|uniref:sensor histidine kinase n=1 Tax=Kolteria novifilia TaxID=2527975 RepID=UPI003AF37002